jgi:hypothetical protein
LASWSGGKVGQDRLSACIEQAGADQLSIVTGGPYDLHQAKSIKGQPHTAVRAPQVPPGMP